MADEKTRFEMPKVGVLQPEVAQMDERRVVEDEKLAKLATGNPGSTITVKEQKAAHLPKQDDRIFMGRVEDGEGLPHHRPEHNGAEPQDGEAVFVAPERGPWPLADALAKDGPIDDGGSK